MPATLSRMDVAVPALVLAVGVTELVSFGPAGLGWAIALETLACVLLVWRRHRPILVCSLAAVANAALPFVGPRLEDVATPILIGVVISYSLARWVESLRGLAGLAVLALAVVGDYLFADDRLHNISDLVFVAALLAPPYVFGRISRRLALTTELLREQQELVRRQAVREERDRIARELHDVIAHSLSAMVVQTAAAQDVVRSDPDRAEDALQKVADTGRRALAETGRLLHVIRDADGELGLEPTPGLAQVPALVQGFRQDGLDVRAVLDDSPDLPAAVDTSAYRLVQEALTNALRYSPDRVVELEVRSDGQRLRIRSSNRADGHAGHHGRAHGRGPGAGRSRRAGHAARRRAAARAHPERAVRARRRPADRPDDVSAPTSLRVVVADDQDLVRSGLEMVLGARGIEVVGLAADGREAVEQVRDTVPDVVLMDIRMPTLDGIAATREIVASGTAARVLVLTTYDLDTYVYDALRAGAAGFLLKATPPDRLVEGIRTVAAGEALLAPTLTRRLIEEHVRRPQPSTGVPAVLRDLTDREREVFGLVARGLSNDQICRELVLSEATVKTHVNRILSKLGGLTRVQLVVLAYESGFVRPGDSPKAVDALR